MTAKKNSLALSLTLDLSVAQNLMKTAFWIVILLPPSSMCPILDVGVTNTTVNYKDVSFKDKNNLKPLSIYGLT